MGTHGRFCERLCAIEIVANEPIEVAVRRAAGDRSARLSKIVVDGDRALTKQQRNPGRGRGNEH